MGDGLHVRLLYVKAAFRNDQCPQANNYAMGYRKDLGRIWESIRISKTKTSMNERDKILLTLSDSELREILFDSKEDGDTETVEIITEILKERMPK